jgi:hypothetical protein
MVMSSAEWFLCFIIWNITGFLLGRGYEISKNRKNKFDKR